MPIVFQTASGSAGTSHSIDVGVPGNNRLVIAIFGDESTSGSVFTGSFTVNSNTFTQALVSDNPDGIGNHLEFHTIDERGLGSTSGTQTVSYSGGDAGSAVHVLVFYGVKSETLIDSDIEDTVIGFPVICENITTNNNSLVVFAAGNGSGGTASNFTGPLTIRTNGPNPSSAVLATASGIEISRVTNKSYQCDLGEGTLRSTGIVAVFDQYVPTHQFVL